MTTEPNAPQTPQPDPGQRSRGQRVLRGCGIAVIVFLGLALAVFGTCMIALGG